MPDAPGSLSEAAYDLGWEDAAPEAEPLARSDLDALGLSTTARAVLRWGGYEGHPEATDELVDAGLVRWASERREPCYVLTERGGDAFVLLGELDSGRVTA